MSDNDALRIARLEYAVELLAASLVEAQTGLGELHAKGIRAILDGKLDDSDGIKSRLERGVTE